VHVADDADDDPCRIVELGPKAFTDRDLLTEGIAVGPAFWPSRR
jgi:hypothetical protein